MNNQTIQALGLAILASSAHATDHWQMNMTQGVTPISHHIYDLHMLGLYICCGIGAVVFSVLFYTLYKYRKSKGAVAADFHENTKLEILWAVVPFLILITMAVPATRVLQQMHQVEDADMTIKVTGYQWYWKYEYLDHNVSFFSRLSTPLSQIDAHKMPTVKNEWYLLEVDRPMVIPVNKKVRFVVTAADVIHSWWVPALGIKRDAIPGFIHESWARVETPGVYRGQCAELCGSQHGFMPIVVQAVSEEEFNNWVTQRKAEEAAAAAPAADLSKEELFKKGEQVYLKVCAACHQPNGTGMPPAFPALKGDGIAIGPVGAHIDVVLHGRKGSAMQAFGEQLDDVSLAAVITYERLAWGNENNHPQEQKIVQPSDIKKAREKK